MLFARYILPAIIQTLVGTALKPDVTIAATELLRAIHSILIENNVELWSWYEDKRIKSELKKILTTS